MRLLSESTQPIENRIDLLGAAHFGWPCCESPMPLAGVSINILVLSLNTDQCHKWA